MAVTKEIPITLAPDQIRTRVALELRSTFQTVEQLREFLQEYIYTLQEVASPVKVALDCSNCPAVQSGVRGSLYAEKVDPTGCWLGRGEEAQFDSNGFLEICLACTIGADFIYEGGEGSFDERRKSLPCQRVGLSLPVNLSN